MASPQSAQHTTALHESQPLLTGYSAHHRDSSQGGYGALGDGRDDETVTLNVNDDGESEGSETVAGSDLDETSPTLLNSVSSLDFYLILAALWSAVFLGALDGTIVATLLTPIGSHFQKSNRASYIGTSYLLSLCCFTPLYGRLSDILGRKGAMLLALALFGSGTLLCGLAQSMEALIIARTIAGMGGGGIMTVSSVTVTDLVPLKQRGLYQGVANILYGLGAGIGGPFGGWINDSLGWRHAFLLQIPFLLASVTLVIWKVNIQLPGEIQAEPLARKLRKIDFFGCCTLVGTVASLLLGFSLKSTERLPWTHPVIVGLFVSSAAFGLLFFLTEKYWAPWPVMPLRLICKRTPLAVSLTNLVSSISAFSTLYNVPLFFESVRLISAADAGLYLLPHSFAISAGSVFAGWMMRRTGKLFYLTLSASGLTILASLLQVTWTQDTSKFRLWMDIIPQGFGMAALITTTLIAIIADVWKEDVPVAIGITYLFRTTGQVLGVSLSGAIVQSVLMEGLKQRFKDPEIISRIRHSTEFIKTLPLEQRQAAVNCYADALHIVFICQLACNFLGFLTCLPIQENSLPGTREEQENHYRQIEEPGEEGEG